MSVIYIHLTYEHYKSLRLQIDNDTIIEFHGPLVGGYGHAE